MSTGLDFAEINRAAVARIDDVMARFVPGGTRQGAEYVTKNPTRADAHPGSFKVNCNTGVWADFATGDKGRDLISLVAYITSSRQVEAGKALATFLFLETPPAKAKTEQPGTGKGLSRVVAEFKFHHADGEECYRKQRFEPGWNGEKKSFSFYRMIDGKKTKGGGGWHLLYRLPEVIKAEMVIICEGEKKADTVAAWGMCGTSLDTGSKSKLSPEMVRHLHGKAVVILIDNDDPGKEYGDYLARTLHGKAQSVKVINLPGLGPKEDVIDWQKLPGNDGDRLREIITAAPTWRPEPDPAAPTGPDAETAATRLKRRDAAALLQAIGLELPLYCDPAGEPYTCIDNRMIRVEAAESWLTWQFYQQTDAYASSESLKGVIRLLVAKAHQEGERIQLFNRVGTHGGAIMVDLGAGRCAKITPAGVTIGAPPPLFRSFPHQQEHPEPDLNGDPWRFLEFCNVAKERRLVVMVALVAAFVPEIIHPLFMVHGPARSGKSHFCKFFKRIIDPSSIELSFFEDDNLKDLFATLREHYVYAPDNVSKLSNKISDILCQAVTGVTVSQKLLYTNFDTVQADLKNIVLLNGIPTLLNRADLNDRAIALYLERLKDDQLQGESIIKARFDAAVPEIIGGCFRVLSQAMALKKELHDFTSPIRLYDFAKWGFCIAEALGEHGSRFLEDLKRDYRQQSDDLIENNLLATVLLECLGIHGPEWKTTAQTAYSILMEATKLDKKDLLRDPTFPHKVQDLRRHLDRLRPVLEEWGITYRYGLRSTHGVPLTITQTPPAETLETSPAAPDVADEWTAADFEELTP